MEHPSTPAPRLSVIVPVYNVEVYLRECLDSILTQSMGDLEVVVVDDGSPDGSAAIAAEYAERDPRVRLIRKVNAGLGAARNTGIEASDPRAEFLTFVDSDDMVAPDAYRRMIGSLDESGSDLVTGNVHYFNSEKSWQVPLLKVLSEQARQRTHVREDRRLFADRVSWNKVYRRSFWDRNAFRFPEGVLYEDTPVTIPAHALASAVDTLSATVYYWRLRDGEMAGTSITQRRTSPEAVRDRVGAVRSVSSFFASRPEPEFAEFKRDYDARSLRDDLKLFMDVLPDAGEDFRAEFVRSVNAYFDIIDPELVMELPVSLRAKWLLVRKHRMPELLAQLAADRRREPMTVRGGVRKYAALTGLRDSDVKLPKKALRVDKELNLKAPLRDAWWEGGRLVLRGDAWIDRVDQATPRSAVKALQLKKGGSRRRIVQPLRNLLSLECTVNSGQHDHVYDYAGWEYRLDPERLRGRGGQWEEGLWHVGMIFTGGGLARKRAVHASGPSRATHPAYRWLDDTHRLLPFVDRTSVKLRIEKVKAVVLAHRVEPAGGGVLIEGEIRVPVTGVEAASAVLSTRHDVTGDDTDLTMEVAAPDPRGHRAFRVVVPLADFGPDEDGERSGWATGIVLTGSDGKRRRLGAVVRDGLADGTYPVPGVREDGGVGEVALTAGSNGYLKLRGRLARAVMTGFEERSEGLACTFRTHAPLREPVFVVRAQGRFEERVVPVVELGSVRGETLYEAVFDPSRMSGDGRLPLPMGRWNFRLRDNSEAEGRYPFDAPFVMDRLLNPSFPHTSERGGRTYTVEARWHDYPQLNCHSELSDLERGPYRQAQQRAEIYEAMSANEPLRDQVFYLSYNGRQFSDSPRAMLEELMRRGSPLKHLWALRDGQSELPAGVEPVQMFGRKYFEALATSRYIVTNAHLPGWIVRRDGQVIVQTWHGTMLKKIGHDIEVLHFDREYQNRLLLEAKQWSLLVSSNRYSTPILKKAFSYDGEVIEAGYPRNDALYRADGPAVAKQVREAYGIPDDKKIVLYAPTWREDLKHAAGQYKLNLQLDVDDARAKLGDDHVLLIRRHSNVVDKVPGAGNGFVFDVSDHPDIADLYLASDLLITDYSSVMFDFAHTRRPMLFFTYDLEHYRDTLRGFYFDFEKDSPGPLLSTSAEVVDAIRNIDAVSEQYAEKYAEFQHLFCDLDDGSASARVLDRMFELGGKETR